MDHYVETSLDRSRRDVCVWAVGRPAAPLLGLVLSRRTRDTNPQHLLCCKHRWVTFANQHMQLISSADSSRHGFDAAFGAAHLTSE